MGSLIGEALWFDWCGRWFAERNRVALWVRHCALVGDIVIWLTRYRELVGGTALFGW